jgi:acyl transferase domain-containing protein
VCCGWCAVVQEFDTAPFNLSQLEAVMIDPQQRILLEATAAMLSSGTAAAAAGPDGLSDAGVFVGISNPDYADIKKAATSIGVYSATGMSCFGLLLDDHLFCCQQAFGL